MLVGCAAVYTYTRLYSIKSCNWRFGATMMLMWSLVKQSLTSLLHDSSLKHQYEEQCFTC